MEAAGASLRSIHSLVLRSLQIRFSNERNKILGTESRFSPNFLIQRPLLNPSSSEERQMSVRNDTSFVPRARQPLYWARPGASGMRGRRNRPGTRLFSPARNLALTETTYPQASTN